MKDYRVLEPLGKGAFASVFKVRFSRRRTMNPLARADDGRAHHTHTHTARADGPALIPTHALTRAGPAQVGQQDVRAEAYRHLEDVQARGRGRSERGAEAMESAARPSALAILSVDPPRASQIRILASVRHPYIVGFMQAFTGARPRARARASRPPLAHASERLRPPQRRTRKSCASSWSTAAAATWCGTRAIDRSTPPPPSESHHRL